MLDSLNRLAADLHLAPDTALALALGFAAVVALGVLVILVLLLRPRKPVADPAAEQRLMELNAGSMPWGAGCRTRTASCSRR